MEQQFFIDNRRHLNGLTILSSYRSMQRGNDAAFAFEQEANFWYLTGINAPDWTLINDKLQNKSWLVAPDIDIVHQIFDGSLSDEEAKNISGVDEVISKTQANHLLREIALKQAVVYTLGIDPRAETYDFVINPAQQELTKELNSIFNEVKDCRSELVKLRSIKQPVEIDAIKKAIKLTNDAFLQVKEILPNLQYEYQVEAEFSYRLRSNGAIGHAYDPIVASGNNAVTLHYNANDQSIKKDSLILIDIGARFNGYAADVTRTYSVGHASERQVAVHGAVEKAHRHIIGLLKPGLSVKKYQQEVDQIMQDVLIDLGLIKTRSDMAGYRKYFPHAISHGLGIDVHDSLGAPTKFAPGMVLTVEPGIYIQDEGIGVRIEDDILITSTGYENLSISLPTSL